VLKSPFRLSVAAGRMRRIRHPEDSIKPIDRILGRTSTSSSGCPAERDAMSTIAAWRSEMNVLAHDEPLGLPLRGFAVDHQDGDVGLALLIVERLGHAGARATRRSWVWLMSIGLSSSISGSSRGHGCWADRRARCLRACAAGLGAMHCAWSSGTLRPEAVRLQQADWTHARLAHDRRPAPSEGVRARERPHTNIRDRDDFRPMPRALPKRASALLPLCSYTCVTTAARSQNRNLWQASTKLSASSLDESFKQPSSMSSSSTPAFSNSGRAAST
jgi:hypothetical protein